MGRARYLSRQDVPRTEVGTGRGKGDPEQLGPRSSLHPQKLGNYTPVHCRGGRPLCVHLHSPCPSSGVVCSTSLSVYSEETPRVPGPCCEHRPMRTGRCVSSPCLTSSTHYRSTAHRASLPGSSTALHTHHCQVHSGFPPKANPQEMPNQNRSGL